MTNIKAIVKTRNDLDVLLNSYKAMFAGFPTLLIRRFVYTSTLTKLCDTAE